VSGRQHPHPGGQLGRHVQDVLAVSDQPLGQWPAHPAGALHRPAPLRPGLGPSAQGLIASIGGRELLLVQQLTGLVESGGGVGGLVGVDPDGHRHAGTFLAGGQGTEEGRPTWGRGRPLWSHSWSGAGRTA
jgi:hypothetical protein